LRWVDHSFKGVVPSVLTFLRRKEREKKRVRKDSIRVEEKRKHLEESEMRFISEGGKRASC
jgi:hypothetical protein